jgi:hypothetical protein
MIADGCFGPWRICWWATTIVTASPKDALQEVDLLRPSMRGFSTQGLKKGALFL